MMGKVIFVYGHEVVFTKRTLYCIWPFLVFVAKFMRYSIFRQNLVDVGIGHAFLEAMKNENVKFSLLNTDNNIFADYILTVVNAVFVVNVLNPERDKYRKAFCG